MPHGPTTRGGLRHRQHTPTHTRIWNNSAGKRCQSCDARAAWFRAFLQVRVHASVHGVGRRRTTRARAPGLRSVVTKKKGKKRKRTRTIRGVEVFEGGLQGERRPPFRKHTRRREVRRRLCVGKRRAAHERRCVCHVVSNLLIRFAAAAALRIPRASRSLLVALRRAASWFFVCFFSLSFPFLKMRPPAEL